jgi:uncharacterized protein (TIGR03435 family)
LIQAPVVDLIGAAYGVPYPGLTNVQITGGPEWMRSWSDAYDVELPVPPGVAPESVFPEPRNEAVRVVLRDTLAERFALIVRSTTKTLPVYQVHVAPGGARLQAANSPSAFWGGRGRGVHGQASIGDFVLFVEHWTDRPLVDRTGLNGMFRFETEGWLPITAPGQGPLPWNKWEDGRLISEVPTVFQTFNRLGLDLKPAKGKVPVIVVERIQRPKL